MTQVADKHMASSTWFGQLPANDSPSWLDALRKEGADRFDAVGFPSTKHEQWRFTQLSPITKTKFRPAARDGQGRRIAEAVEQFTFDHDAVSELVFVNGHFEPQLSRMGNLPRGVQVAPLSEAIESDPARV